MSQSETITRAPVSRGFVVAWKTPIMRASAYACYRIRTNAESRVARFKEEFPGGEVRMYETDLPNNGVIFLDDRGRL